MFSIFVARGFFRFFSGHLRAFFVLIHFLCCAGLHGSFSSVVVVLTGVVSVGITCRVVVSKIQFHKSKDSYRIQYPPRQMVYVKFEHIH